MSENSTIERFLNISFLYFQLTGKTAHEISNDDLEEWIVFINTHQSPANSPESMAA